jgi:hypothetical protein
VTLTLRNEELEVDFDGGFGEVFLDDVGNDAGTDLVLCDTAGLHRLGGAEWWRSALKLTCATCYTLYQAVLVVEGILSRHAFHPVSRR